MADPLQLKLSSLAEARLRFDFLKNWLQETPIEESAATLEQLLADAEAFAKAARAALLPLVSWLSGAVDPARAQTLAGQAEGEGHHRLARLTQYTAGEAALCFEQAPRSARIPNYGQRPLTLGERKSLARVPTRRKLDLLLQDPHPSVIERLLQNPRLTEPDVLRLVARRPARVELAALVMRSPRWLMCGSVRLGVVLNPNTPLWQSVPVLSTLRRQELVRVQTSAHVPPELRVAAMDRRNKVPPIPARLRSQTLH